MGFPGTRFAKLLACAMMLWGSLVRAEDEAAKQKQEELRTQLGAAMEAGDGDQVKKLAGQGVDLDTSLDSLFSPTPLILAVHRGDLKMVELLLQLGAKVNLFDNHGCTALHEAVSVGALGSDPFAKDQPKEDREKIIRALLKAGADINAQSGSSGTPLMAAVHDLPTVKLLLEQGAKADSDALLEAARASQPEVLDELIKHGAKAMEKLPNQQTLFHLIATRILRPDLVRVEDQEAVLDRLLKEGVPVDAVDEFGNSALHLAAAQGEKVLVGWLLDHYADPQRRDGENHTPLWWSAQAWNNSADVALLLRRHGADVEGGENDEGDFLELLVAHGNWAALEPLLEADWKPRSPGHFLLTLARAETEKAPPPELLLDMISRLMPLMNDPNDSDQEGVSIFMWAVRAGHQRAVASLLKERKLKLNQRDHVGRTALIWSGMVGNEALQRQLLQAGADASLKDDTGRTAADYLKLTRLDAVDEKLSTDDGSAPNGPEANPTPDVFVAVSQKDPELLRRIITGDPSSIKQRRAGQMPLQVAAATGWLEGFQMLLQAGAAREITGEMESPASLAIHHGHVQPALAWLRRNHEAIAESEGAETYLAALWKGDRIDLARALFDEHVPMGETAWRCLRVAAALGDEDFCQRLLERHVPVARPASCKEERAPMSVLEDAVRSHKPEMVKIFLPSINAQPTAQVLMDRALVIACGEGNVEVVKLLLGAVPKPNVNQATRPDDSPSWPQDPFARASTREGGQTPLEAAVIKNSLPILELLCEHGATITGKEALGGILLMQAISFDHEEAFEFLMSHGAEVKGKGANGDTPLHVAAERGNLKIVRALLAAGADAKALGANHDLPGDRALLYNHKEISVMLNGLIGRSSPGTH